MATTIFKYSSGGIVYTQTFTLRGIKGFDDPEKVLLWPPIIEEAADGRRETKFRGFRRVITIDLGVLQTSTERKFIRSFLNANDRTVRFAGSDGVETVFVDPLTNEYENEWIDDVSLSKKYILDLAENYVRTVWPDLTVQPDATDIMYIKNRVQITGTQASPETFTTNSGKLQYNFGTTPFPPISLLDYNVAVMCNAVPYQDAKVNCIKNSVAQSGANITFQLAISDTGAAAADGLFYADIIIALQAIS